MIICESSRYVIALSYCLIFLDISLFFSQFLRLFLFIGISAPWFPNSSRELRPPEGSTHGETNVQKKSSSGVFVPGIGSTNFQSSQGRMGLKNIGNLGVNATESCGLLKFL